MSSAIQIGFERYFWAVNLVFLLATSYLSARTVNLFVAEKIRPPPAAGSTGGDAFARPAAASELSADAFAHLMGMALPEDRAGPGEAAAAEQDQQADLSTELVRSSLHAQLLATVLANRPEWSLATLRDLNANETSIYMVGDTFMGATVLDIQDLKAIILNNGHREFIDTEVGGTGGPTPVASAAPKQNQSEGIRRVDDHHFQIERSTVNNALANLNELAMQARIVPSFKNGQANGFKLFSIRPDSLYSKIGIQNGDVIQRINGYDMNSPDKALEAYTKLRNANSLDLTVERNGQAQSFHYAIQ